MKNLIFSFVLAFLVSFLAYSKTDVEIFLLRTYQYEGSKFTDTKFDGHYTKYGIILPTLEKYYSQTQKGDIDQDKKITWNDIRLLNWELAVDIYKELYWLPGQGDKFKSQRNANLTVDFFVNSGFRPDFIKSVQKLVGSKQDGIIGIQTARAINSYDECLYFNRVMLWRKGYYARIVKANPQRLGKLLNGLNNRLIKICKNENFKNDSLLGCDCMPLFVQPKNTGGKSKGAHKKGAIKPTSTKKLSRTGLYYRLRNDGHDSYKNAFQSDASSSGFFVLVQQDG
jgi:hypothetical protein